jgi:hypothetical protein
MRKFAILHIVIFIVFLGLVIWLFNTTQYTPVIGLGGAVGTIYFGLIKYWIDRDTIFLNLFNNFNKRFDEMNEGLNCIIKAQELKGTKTKEQVIQDYLNLCAEEYFWYKKGRIPEKVWNSWREGIHFYLKDETIRSHFLKEKQYSKSYYDLFKGLSIT